MDKRLILKSIAWAASVASGATLLAGCGGSDLPKSAQQEKLLAVMSTDSGPVASADWAEGRAYAVGDVVRYNGHTYTARSNFTNVLGANWFPDVVPALWARDDEGTGTPVSPVSPTTPATPLVPVSPTTPVTPVVPPVTPGQPAGMHMPVIPPTLTPTGGQSFLFGPYRDVPPAAHLNWQTGEFTSDVDGTPKPFLDVLPTNISEVSLAFATGECGSEDWGGATSNFIASSVSKLAQAGVGYTLSTGGANAAFTCSTDDGFKAFLKPFLSAKLRGVDFDIESGQTEDQILNLVMRAKAAQKDHPGMRFSFTLQTLGGAEKSQGVPSDGVGGQVMRAIAKVGLEDYYINLMVMDYGDSSTSCSLDNSTHRCDMGQSAINAANGLQRDYGVPFDHIELTPMIGLNDTHDQTGVFTENFTKADVAKVVKFVKEYKLGGLHYWAFDRDTDCPATQPACGKAFAQGGTLGYAKAFTDELKK